MDSSEKNDIFHFIYHSTKQISYETPLTKLKLHGILQENRWMNKVNNVQFEINDNIITEPLTNANKISE